MGNPLQTVCYHELFFEAWTNIYITLAQISIYNLCKQHSGGFPRVLRDEIDLCCQKGPNYAGSSHVSSS